VASVPRRKLDLQHRGSWTMTPTFLSIAPATPGVVWVPSRPSSSCVQALNLLIGREGIAAVGRRSENGVEILRGRRDKVAAARTLVVCFYFFVLVFCPSHTCLASDGVEAGPAEEWLGPEHLSPPGSRASFAVSSGNSLLVRTASRRRRSVSSTLFEAVSARFYQQRGSARPRSCVIARQCLDQAVLAPLGRRNLDHTKSTAGPVPPEIHVDLWWRLSRCLLLACRSPWRPVDLPPLARAPCCRDAARWGVVVIDAQSCLEISSAWARLFTKTCRGAAALILRLDLPAIMDLPE